MRAALLDPNFPTAKDDGKRAERSAQPVQSSEQAEARTQAKVLDSMFSHTGLWLGSLVGSTNQVGQRKRARPTTP
jgi:hypothetical protein